MQNKAVVDQVKSHLIPVKGEPKRKKQKYSLQKYNQKKKQRLNDVVNNENDDNNKEVEDDNKYNKV